MHQPRAEGLAFPALLTGNLFLAAGPWMVRLADVGPTASAFWRFALALPLLALLAFRGGSGPIDRRLIGAVMLGGLFFAIDLVLWHESILRTRLANATLFGNMSSLLFVLYGFVAMRALPRPMQVAALVLACAGAALLLGGSYEVSPAHFTGDLLALAAAFFYALYLIAADRARRTIASWPVLAIATAAGSLPLLLFALAMGEAIMPGDWTPLLLLALGSQLIGQGLLVFAIGHLSPAVVGIGLLTQPVASAAIGWFAYRESLSMADAIGALLVCAALVLIRLPARGVATPAAPAQ